MRIADNSHEISYLFFSKIRKDVANLSSAAVMIGTLRVKQETLWKIVSCLLQRNTLYHVDLCQGQLSRKCMSRSLYMLKCQGHYYSARFDTRRYHCCRKSYIII